VDTSWEGAVSPPNHALLQQLLYGEIVSFRAAAAATRVAPRAVETPPSSGLPAAPQPAVAAKRLPVPA